MKFGILVLEGPYQHEAADSAYQFAKTAIAKGHTIEGIFFYTDGVNNVNKFMKPPAERVISRRWSEFAEEHDVDMVACVAGAIYRGMTKEIATEHVRIAGLGQLAELAQKTDRLVSFGD